MTRLASEGFKEIFSGFQGSVTFTLQEAFLPFWVLTVILAEPSPTAVTTPLLLTVATEVLEDSQVSLALALEGVSVVFSVSLLPMTRLASEGFKEIFSGFQGSVTFTLQEAFLPFWVLTVILAEPSPTAVTTPEADTVATFSFDEE